MWTEKSHEMHNEKSPHLLQLNSFRFYEICYLKFKTKIQANENGANVHMFYEHALVPFQFV